MGATWVCRAAAVAAVLIGVAWTLLGPAAGDARRRLLVWAGSGAGLGLDLLYRATSSDDIGSTGDIGFAPSRIEPTTSGLVAVVVGAVAFVVAGRLARSAPAEVPATQSGERA